MTQGDNELTTARVAIDGVEVPMNEERRLACCEGKQPFQSMSAAQRAIHPPARRDGVQAYRCKACGNWHVGRSGKNKLKVFKKTS